MYRIDVSTAAGALPAPTEDGPNPGGYFTDGNPGSGSGATIPGAEWFNMVQEELVAILTAAGIEPDKADRAQLLAAIQAVAGQQRGYDIPFLAGFDGFGAAIDLAVQLYGSVVAARSFKITGSFGYMGTPPTGAAVEMDVKLNGVTIFSDLPSFAVDDAAFDAGALDGIVNVAAGDRLDFSVAQIGSGNAGRALRFTLKGETT